MTVENIPLWTLRPNWREAVLETLSWPTTILASPSGAEQRFSLRVTPERRFEVTFEPLGPERAWLDNALTTASALRWYVPVFPDVGRTTAAIGAPSATIPVATANREFAIGGFVMVWRDLFTASVHEITDIAADSLTVEPNVGVTPSGTLVYPCAVMRIGERPEIARLTDRLGRCRLAFEVDGASPSPAATLAATYEGSPVLATPPNESTDLTTSYNRLVAELANGRSRRVVVDTANRNFSIQRHAWLRIGATEHADLRAYLYALQGRRVATWLPTFAADFDLVGSAGSGATQITVARCGFTRFGGPRFGREHIRIERTDGPAIMRRITASSEVNNTETLTLSSALGAAISPATVRRISFMALCRLDQDSVEFTHHTDKAGASSLAVAFRGAGNFRSVTAVPAMPFVYGVQTPQLCGDPLPPPPSTDLGRTYVWGDFNGAQLPLGGGLVGWNAFVVDDNNASGLVGAPPGSVAQSLAAPLETTEALIKAQMRVRTLGGSVEAVRTMTIQKRANGSAPWVDILSNGILIGACSSVTCGPHPPIYIEQTVPMLPGEEIRMILSGGNGNSIWYNRSSLTTYMDVYWKRPGSPWFPLA